MTLEASHVKIQTMNKLEDSLNKIAENILYLDEASLTSLWEKYKAKMEHFSFSPDWEKSVVIFSIINSIRVKNAIFNEQLLNKKTAEESSPAKRKPEKPTLRLVK
ncbi:MAG: hypothetical protein K4571_05430 [Deltaproteobacteria bacterium]